MPNDVNIYIIKYYNRTLLQGRNVSIKTNVVPKLKGAEYVTIYVDCSLLTFLIDGFGSTLTLSAT